MSNRELKIGFIGTGAIASATVIGLIDHSNFEGQVVVSERSKTRSTMLTERFNNVTIASGNQAIVDQCNWIVLSILPKQLQAMVAKLDFRMDQTVISLVAGFDVHSLKKMVAPAEKVHRLIPLPPIEKGVGPLPLFPPSSDISRVFAGCGQMVQTENEDHFLLFSAASALMATHHNITATVAKWIQAGGVDKEAAAAYCSHMFHALTALESDATADQLAGLADESVTVGGLNEQVLNELRKIDWFDQIPTRLDRILNRLNGN